MVYLHIARCVCSAVYKRRSWRSSKRVACGASTPQGRKTSRSYSSFKEFMESVCLFQISYLPFSLRASALQGQSIAYAWYFAGCRTLDDIRERKGGIKLSSIQELGLKYYDGALSHPRDVTTGLSDLVITDINTRMPREEARVIFEEIRSIGKSSRWPSARIGVYDLP